ncbi:MAG: type II secretion system protein [Lysobacteraceae bacterium]
MSFTPRHRQAGHRQQGFTLIEIVAAFAILAIGLALSMSIASGALSQVRRGSDFSMAALNAKSLLDSVGAGTRLEEGGDSGEFDDGSRWDLEITEYEPELVASGALATLSPVDMYYLRLTVYWNEGRSERQATFSTLRTLTPDRGR